MHNNISLQMSWAKECGKEVLDGLQHPKLRVLVAEVYCAPQQGSIDNKEVY